MTPAAATAIAGDTYFGDSNADYSAMIVGVNFGAVCGFGPAQVIITNAKAQDRSARSAIVHLTTETPTGCGALSSGHLHRQHDRLSDPAWECAGRYTAFNSHNQALTLRIDTAVPSNTVLAAAPSPRLYILANR